MTLHRGLPVLASAVLAIALAAVRPPAAGAQSLLLEQENVSYVGFELLKPHFPHSYNNGLTTLSIYASVRYKVSEQTAVVAEIPYAHWDPKSSSYDSEAQAGNIYLGLEHLNVTSGSGTELGIRLPTAGHSDTGRATRVSAYSDLNRWEGAYDELWAIQAAFNFRFVNQKGMRFRLRVGPYLFIPTNGADTELMGLYAVHAYRLGEKGQVTVGFSGRMLMTEAGPDLAGRTFHQFDMGGSLYLQRLRPGVNVRVPLDSNGGVHIVYGFQLGVLID